MQLSMDRQDPVIRSVVVTSRYQDQTREVLVEVGREYEVQSLNPRRTKNRGRRCMVLGFITELTSFGKAEVRFLDTGRRGLVDREDLAVPKSALH
jgi:hypothetical protein